MEGNEPNRAITPLRIGCLFAWLLYLGAIALTIALFANCGPPFRNVRGTFSASATFVVIYFVIGMFLALFTAMTLLPPEKKDGKPQTRKADKGKEAPSLDASATRGGRGAVQMGRPHH